MKIIGLTGGIGSGKSTVSNYLRERGDRVLDADRIAKDVVRPGEPALESIERVFGPEILQEDGTLNRPKLASMILADEERKTELEKITHRAIIEEIERGLREAEEEGLPRVFIDAPLLFEAGLDRYAQEVWLVTAPEETRIERVMARDGISRELVEGYIANQMPEEEKQRRATYVLDNSGTREYLYGQLEDLLDR